MARKQTNQLNLGLSYCNDLNFMQRLDSIFRNQKATFTKAINAKSTNGPITPAKACPLLMPIRLWQLRWPIRNCFRGCKGNSGTFRIVGTKVLPTMKLNTNIKVK
jgi:hypothetical protein